MNKANMKFNKIFQTIITFSFSILFFACANAFNNNSQSANNTIVNTEQKTVTITGQISIPDDFTESGAFPDKYLSLFESKDDTNARTAFPSAPTSTDYYVTAKIAGVATVNATISNESVTGATYTITFPIYDQSPDWDVEAGLKATFNENTEAIILKDTHIATITQTTPTFNHDFIIKPLTSGTGDVDLEISYQTSGTADTLELYLGTTDIPTTPETAGTGETISTSKITLKNRTAGSYKAKLVFKKDGYVVFTDYQNINIFPNMTTNKWVSSGGNGPITSSNTYRVTDTLVSDYLITQIYVGTTAIDGSTITGSDTTGNGTIFAPYATFSKAIGYLQKNGKTNKNYTIWIVGEITGAQTISDGTTASPTKVLANSITISGINGNTTDKLSGGTSGSVLYLDTSVPVKISNLTITGGKGTTVSSTLYGGGIYINKGSVELTTGVVVDGNTADVGGGVYLAHGTLYLNDTAVVGKPLSALGANPTCAGTTSGTYANKATVTGGGISIEEGTLWLGYSSAATPAPVTTSGGVIYNLVTSSSGSCHGGGIDNNKGTINFAKGNVKYNFACGSGNTSADIGSGGGISTAYTFNLSGDAVISNNKAANGGGVYITTNSTNGNLVMSGGTVSSNNAVKQPETNGYGGNGGGINIETSATLSMSGGEISSNEAASSGGAIYHNGTFEITKVAGGTTCTAMIPKGTDNKNNIQLASTDKKIKITGQTNHAGNGAIAVTPARWKRGDQIFANGSTASYFSKFTLTDSEWSIVSYTVGTNTTGRIDAPLYVAGTTSQTISGVSYGAGKTPANGGLGTKAKPYSTIDDAVAQCWHGPNDTVTNTGRTITIVGEVSGGHAISSSITTTVNATAITLAGINANAKLNGGFSNGNTGRPLTITTDVPIIIQNLTITNGYTSNGGGIYVSKANASLTLTTGAVVTGNTATASGGGIYFQGATGNANIANLVMNSTSKIQSNIATNTGGGIYLNCANLCMCGSALIGDTTGTSHATSANNGYSNKATNGAGVYIADSGSSVWLGYTQPSDEDDSKSTLSTTYGIRHNYASTSGGGIYNKGGSITFDTGEISFNGTAGSASSGGGISIMLDGTTAGVLNLKGGKIKGNYSYDGGGVYSEGSIAMTGGTIGDKTYPNEGVGQGGGVTSTNRFTMSGGLIGDDSNSYIAKNQTGNYANKSAKGAGLCISSSQNTYVSITSGSIEYNYATSSGGGIYLGSGWITIGCNVARNGAYNGGGVYSSDYDFTLKNAEFTSNKADNLGGACYLEAKVDNRTITFDGSTSIPSSAAKNNDVYLNSDAVSGKLARICGSPGTMAGTDIVATITPSTYNASRLVCCTSLNNTSVVAEIRRFAITPQSSQTWGIGDNGYLKTIIGTKSKPTAVGDIVFSDGSARPYEAGMSLTTDQQDKAIAFTIYAGKDCNNEDESGNRYLAVGRVYKNNNTTCWCITSAKAHTGVFNSIACSYSGSSPNYTFSGVKNGKDNFTRLKTALAGNDDTGTPSKYPGFNFGNNYKSQTNANVTGTSYESGWYLPSVAELFYFYKNIDIINSAAALYGITYPTTALLSSSLPYDSNGAVYYFAPDSKPYSNSSRQDTRGAIAIHEF